MAQGFRGLLDFAGYPVGAPPVAAATAGFVGLLDFTGIPVGNDSGAPPILELPHLVGFCSNVGTMMGRR